MQIERIVSHHLDSNTYVVGLNNECLIIDAGAEIENVIQKVGTKKVVGILLTHGHFDHAFNIIEYAKRFSSNIYASKLAKSNIVDPAKNYGENFAITDFSHFVWIDGDSQFSLGDFDIKSYSLPGHSKCCTGYLIEDVLFAGDVLFARGIGRIDLHDSDKNEMFDSLKKLQTIQFSQVASGHGEMSTAEWQKRNISVFIKYLSRNK